MADGPTRDELVEACEFAWKRLREAKETRRCDRQRSLQTLRDLMVAQDEFKNLTAELAEFDNARDVQVIRRSAVTRGRER